MKFLLLLTLLLALISCGENTPPPADKPLESESNEVVFDDFQTILDDAGLDGSILIYDGANFYSNNFDWAKQGYLPASTFKIPNSIIALELGIMENDSTMIEWDGEPRFMKRWEQNLVFRDAFHVSCVPCYQDIAREVGVRRMQEYTYNFNFGDMDIDSSNIDMFWLEGESRISQFQQIEFLKSFNERRLTISERTHKLMRRMMIIEENDGFILRGKTGWSVTDDQDNCWFVGWVETDEGFYYFATNIEPREETESNDLFTIRKEATYAALEFIVQ
jgi:beta-lactamase class D